MSGKLYYLAIPHVSAVDGKFYDCADTMPAGCAGRPGIDVEKVQLFVVNYFQYVGMPGNHQPDALLSKQRFHTLCPFAGIAAYVSEQNLNTLNTEYLKFTAFSAHHSMIDVSANGTHHGSNILKTLHYAIVANVAGMPYLIAIFKILSKAIIPAAMSVA